MQSYWAKENFKASIELYCDKLRKIGDDAEGILDISDRAKMYEIAEKYERIAEKWGQKSEIDLDLVDYQDIGT